MSLAEDVEAIGSELTRVGESFDVDCLSGPDAARLLSLFRVVEHKAAALKLSCGRRAVAAGVHVQSGARDGATWFANEAGISVGEARSLLSAAKAMETLAPVAKAFAAGEVSPEQLRHVAAGCDGDAERAKGLLKVAKSSSVAKLKKTCRQGSGSTSAEAEADRHERLRKRQYLRTWNDADGMVCGEFRLLAEHGALLLSRLRPYADAAFNAARKLGLRESLELYGAEGFVALIESSGGEARPVRAEVIVVADYDALIRGYAEAGERCEVEGIGPVPVALVQQLRNDCYLSQVVVKDGKPAIVKGKGHYIPDKLRVAVKIRDGGCVVPKCGSRHRTQIDHINPVHKGGPTVIGNLQELCPRHHSMKTHQGFDIHTVNGEKQWFAA